jgi:hypothetical protein
LLFTQSQAKEIQVILCFKDIKKKIWYYYQHVNINHPKQRNIR